MLMIRVRIEGESDQRRNYLGSAIYAISFKMRESSFLSKIMKYSNMLEETYLNWTTHHKSNIIQNKTST